MTNRTAAEAKAHYMQKMGKVLGEQFNALWQDVAFLHSKWSEFVELFGVKASRVVLLNQAAPSFFQMAQDALWRDILLSVARLTDPPNSTGRKGRDNLTILSLPALVQESNERKILNGLVDELVEKAKFCRDWRNRHIAHNDLRLALNESATPLKPATRKQVTEVLAMIARVLNEVDSHYTASETYFEENHPLGGVASLLRVLDDGVRARDKRRERLLKGQLPEEDYPQGM